MAVIRFVDRKSPFRKKVFPGDDLTAVNGQPVRDFLDYMYLTAQGVESLTVLRDGEKITVRAAEATEDPGLEFEQYLMDRQRSCKNKCVFCFIDQLPKHMRETMYYKDDDFRLSLLYGNYVTMTNLTDEDVERIVRMKISPFNVSVHTTNPELRVRMMKNPAAANGFQLMQKFRDAGINLRGQIVLCPDWNDGAELDRTLKDLKTLWPQLSSVSVVPIGLTKFRDGLEPMRSFTPEECRTVLAQIEAFGDQCKAEFGTRLVFASDEFYVKAGVPIPDFDYYEELEQLENGVGMLASFSQDLEDCLSLIEEPFRRPVRVSMVTGQITETFFQNVLNRIRTVIPDLDCRIYAVRNDFFGPEITVTGLVTGQDIIAQLAGKPLGDMLLLPSVMLREDRFLDDVSLSEMETALNIKIKVTDSGAEGFVNALISSARS